MRLSLEPAEISHAHAGFMRDTDLRRSFQAGDGIRDPSVTGVQTCALPICGDPLELRHPAFAEWRRCGAGSVHAAGDHGIMEGNWRRAATVHQWQLSARPGRD